MHTFKKFILIVLLLVFLAGSCVLLWISNHYVVPIIMYHNVEAIDEHRANWVSPEAFEQQMEFLSRHGYEVLSLDELVEAILTRKELSRKSVVITFDDGYENNYTNAYQVLKKYNFPATIFVHSDMVDDIGYLSWEQLEEMSDHKIEIGSHTKSGAYLPSISGRELVDEVASSKKDLEKRLGLDVNYIAYPIGGFSNEIMKIVKQSGYKGALTTNRGFDRYNYDVYQLNRVRFSSKDDSPIILWGKLSGYYNLFRKAKNPF